MIPVKQREHDDCVRAAIASILEREYEVVPHFLRQAEAGGRWWGSLLDQWLEAEGYPFRHGHFAFALKNGRHLSEVFMQSFWLGRPWWYASVKSKTRPDALHAVVMHGNEIAFDPGIHADDPAYQAQAYEFVFANYFYVPEPHRVRRVPASFMEAIN